MRIVVALGGNALLQRGQALNADNQRDNVRQAVKALAAVHAEHELVIAHGNGPQVGLLALMDAAFEQGSAFPLDVLGAESVGMIGYMIEQELGNVVPKDDHIVTLLTQIVVDQNDPAFHHPTKPIGPVYTAAEAEALAAEKGWSLAADGDKMRRVVPSPRPQRIIEIDTIRLLVEKGVIVICAGGGGIPVSFDEQGHLHGVEAVIDKDLASGLLAHQLDADAFIMLTDVAEVFADYGTPEQRAIRRAHPDALSKMDFAAGSMGPKVQGACEFVKASGKMAAIGRLNDLSEILAGNAGTCVSLDIDGIEYA